MQIPMRLTKLMRILEIQLMVGLIFMLIGTSRITLGTRVACFTLVYLLFSVIIMILLIMMLVVAYIVIMRISLVQVLK